MRGRPDLLVAERRFALYFVTMPMAGKIELPTTGD